MFVRKKHVEALNSRFEALTSKINILIEQVSILQKEIELINLRETQKVVTQDDESLYEEELALSRFKR